MTEDEVRAAAERLVEFHERFAPLFGKEQAQDHAYVYVKGLMVCPERKSIEPIALNVGDGRVSALQKFVNIAPWDHGDVQAEIHSVFADELAPTAVGDPIGTVGVIDESGFAKKGDHSAGVARQHNGRLGKEDNCQVGVFLVGVTPGGSALLDHQLYLPESWCEDTEACRDAAQKVHIPESVAFQTKPQIAAGLIRQTVALDIVALDWITADEEYGRNGEFLDELETLERRYVVEVPINTTVWTEDPAGCIPPYGGRGRVPTRPSRESVASVVAVAVGPGARGVADAASPRGGQGAAGLRVRRGPGLGGAPRRGRPAGLAAGAAVVGADARGQVLHQQRRRLDAAGGAGGGGLHAARGRGLLRGRQELPGDGAVRDAVVGRLAPSHELGGDGSSVHHADAARPEKKRRS